MSIDRQTPTSALLPDEVQKTANAAHGAGNETFLAGAE